METLPTELVLTVLSFLGDYKDLARVSQVSPAWRTLAHTNWLWQELFLANFPGRNSRFQLCPDAIEREWKIIFSKSLQSQNRWRFLTNIQSYEILKTIHQGRVYGCAGFDSLGQVFVFGGWNTMTATGPHMLVLQPGPVSKIKAWRDKLIPHPTRLPTTDVSTQASVDPHLPRFVPCAAPERAGIVCVSLPHKNQLLYFGGQKFVVKPKGVCNHVILYETLTKKWFKLTQPEGAIEPEPRAWSTATMVGNKVYVFGGGAFLPQWSQRVLFGDLWVLDLTTWLWTKPKTEGMVPTARAGHVAGVWQDRYVVLYGGGNLGGTKVFGDTFLLDTVLMNWQRIESPGIVPPPLGSAAAIVLGDYFYVFGGWLGQTPHHQDLGSLAVVYKLSLHNHMWERRDLETECRLDPRASMADVFVNGKWFFFGGMSHRGIVNDVLVLDISNPSEDKKYLRSKMRGSAEKPPPKITPAGGNNV